MLPLSGETAMLTEPAVATYDSADLLPEMASLLVISRGS